MMLQKVILLSSVSLMGWSSLSLLGQAEERTIVGASQSAPFEPLERASVELGGRSEAASVSVLLRAAKTLEPLADVVDSGFSKVLERAVREGTPLPLGKNDAPSRIYVPRLRVGSVEGPASFLVQADGSVRLVDTLDRSLAFFTNSKVLPNVLERHFYGFPTDGKYLNGSFVLETRGIENSLSRTSVSRHGMLVEEFSAIWNGQRVADELVSRQELNQPGSLRRGVFKPQNIGVLSPEEWLVETNMYRPQEGATKAALNLKFEGMPQGLAANGADADYLAWLIARSQTIEYTPTEVSFHNGLWTTGRFELGNDLVRPASQTRFDSKGDTLRFKAGAAGNRVEVQIGSQTRDFAANPEAFRLIQTLTNADSEVELRFVSKGVQVDYVLGDEYTSQTLHKSGQFTEVRETMSPRPSAGRITRVYHPDGKQQSVRIEGAGTNEQGIWNGDVGTRGMRVVAPIDGRSQYLTISHEIHGKLFGFDSSNLPHRFGDTRLHVAKRFENFIQWAQSIEVRASAQGGTTGDVLRIVTQGGKTWELDGSGNMTRLRP